MTILFFLPAQPSVCETCRFPQTLALTLGSWFFLEPKLPTTDSVRLPVMQTGVSASESSKIK